MGTCPMVAFRKSKSLADYLAHAKLNRTSGERLQRGVSKCGSKRCEVCGYMDMKDFFVSTATGRRYSINYSLNCNSCNVVCLMTYKSCGLQYVGSTTTKFRRIERMMTCFISICGVKGTTG